MARVRQVAAYLLKALTTRSLNDIGQRFGGRDHTTILCAMRRVEELLLLGDHDVRALIVGVLAMLEARGHGVRAVTLVGATGLLLCPLLPVTRAALHSARSFDAR